MQPSFHSDASWLPTGKGHSATPSMLSLYPRSLGESGSAAALDVVLDGTKNDSRRPSEVTFISIPRLMFLDITSSCI